VRDFSPGGIRVVTSYPLAKGQIVQFDWNIPLPPSMARMLQSPAEVRRVMKNDDGMYDVGFKFTARVADKGANRRRFRRYKCDMTVYYRRKGSELMPRGRVTDISQGGCQMHLDEPLTGGEVFQVRLIGGGGSRGDLVGSMRVCRVIPREVHYETGCAFEKMRMEQQGSLSCPVPAKME
jgi:c-di-GMP-binding flagellar brake protein YcgR